MSVVVDLSKQISDISNIRYRQLLKGFFGRIAFHCQSHTRLIVVAALRNSLLKNGGI